MTVYKYVRDFFADGNGISLDDFVRECVTTLIKRLAEDDPSYVISSSEIDEMMQLLYSGQYLFTIIYENIFYEYMFLYGNNCLPLIQEWKQIGIYWEGTIKT
jgi:hypothetical protein